MGGNLSSPLGSSDGSEEAQQRQAPVMVDAGDPCQISTVKLPVELTSKYEVLEKIGCGSFGSVYKVRRLESRVLYAAKYVETKDSAATEVEIQAKMDNIHVVKIFDTVVIPSAKRLVIIMEYCDGGNLLEWIRRNRRHKLINELIVLNMFQEICEAVYSCHQKMIIHRDLKPENILLDYKRRIKLADFGVARVLHRKSVAMSFCGTPPYMAPELFLSYMSRGAQNQSGIGYDGKCDVWSIGCILWDMANQVDIFMSELKNHPGLNLAQAPSESVGEMNIHQLIDSDIPDSFALTKRLLKRMLVNDSEQRISLLEILQDRELRERLETPQHSHWCDSDLVSRDT